jgi:hypothetical protein
MRHRATTLADVLEEYVHCVGWPWQTQPDTRSGKGGVAGATIFSESELVVVRGTPAWGVWSEQ